jgi:spermidine/putrescine transport system substrate-binding protein
MSIDSAQTRSEFIRRTAGFTALLAGGGGLALGRAAEVWAASSSATLTFVGWEGYDGTPASAFPDLAAWEDKSGIKLNATYIDNNPQIIAKIQASPAGTYDLSSPIHTIVPSMTAADLLEPIPLRKLTNWNSIYPMIRKLTYLRVRQGAVPAVPLGFGYTTFSMFNPALLKRAPRSWNDLLTPAFRGKYAINDLPENLTWIARTLGYGHPDPHHITKAELAKCTAYARRIVRNAKTLSPSFGDLLQLFVAKEIALSVNGTPGLITRAQGQGLVLQKFFTKEGNAGAYMDNFAIPKGSKNADAALSWIDQMISPQTNAELAVVYGGAPVNSKSVPLLPAPLQARYPFKHIEVFFKQTPVFPPQPTSSRIFANYSDWVEAWSAAKA